MFVAPGKSTIIIVLNYAVLDWLLLNYFFCVLLHCIPLCFAVLHCCVLHSDDVQRKVQSRWKTFLAAMDNLGEGEGDRCQGSLRGAPNIRIGVYKGSHVAVRHVTRRHVEVNRALKKALLVRKEMNQENINRFIGACIEAPRVYIVSQFCSRRSLHVSHRPHSMLCSVIRLSVSLCLFLPVSVSVTDSLSLSVYLSVCLPV